MNAAVDREARSWMRMGRAAALRDHGGLPTYEMGILAFHASPFDIERFRPLSHFGSARAAAERIQGDWRVQDGILPGARTYPVLLDIRNPLELGDLGNHTSLDLLAALWERGLADKEDIKRGVSLIAAAEKSVSDVHAWTRSCDAVGLIPGQLAITHPAEADGRAAAISPSAFAEAYLAHWGTPSGIQQAVRDARFPHANGACHAADRLVVDALVRSGHDGIVYDNQWEDRDSRSWIIVRPSQATVLASPALAPRRVSRAPQDPVVPAPAFG